MKMFRVSPVGTAESSLLISAATELEAACKYLMEHPSRADLSVGVPGGASVVVKNAHVIAAFPDLAALVATAPVLEAKAPAAEPVAAPVSESGSVFDNEPTEDYSKLGGWLWVALFVLVAGLVVDTISAKDTFALLTNPDIDQIAERFPQVVPFVKVELAGSLLMIMGAGVAIPLFLMRKRITRPLLIALFALDCGIYLTDTIWGSMILGDLMDRATIVGNVRSIVICGIWTAYFIFSERVKKTFVR